MVGEAHPKQMRASSEKAKGMPELLKVAGTPFMSVIWKSRHFERLLQIQGYMQNRY